MPKRNIVDSNYFIGIKNVTDNEKWLIMQNNNVVETQNFPENMNTITEIMKFTSEQNIELNPEWNKIGIK